MAMATMVDQASRRPLTSTVGNNGHEGNANMTQILRQHMDASRDRRLGHGGGGDGRHQRRVRHPAGDRYSGSRDVSPFVPPRVAVQDDSDLHGSRLGSLHSFPVDDHHYGQHLQHHHHHRDTEDDRHSHGSDRSGRSRGQRTPSPRPHYHDRGGNDSTTLTYYGIVDRGGDIPASAASPSAPSYSDVVQPGQDGAEPPPPSYEEAATGKYDP
ncbi:hypothetical protein PoB_005604000 [Plakobranchus ocellatus]|uniref:Uncharacterized protein n=1 Tax=Plakobranchus ocellatus TaxID=259542 RepID=A0AAV4CDP1_9GAST|nr:hypothetical protein PoB_005604000 [Plakobranchus ocellatus]